MKQKRSWSARALYRRALKWLLFRSWRASLPFGERARLDYWGATGNADHHPFMWAEWEG